MKEKKKSDVSVLLDYAGSHKGLTFLGLTLSAVSMVLSMAPYICIWLAAVSYTHLDVYKRQLFYRILQNRVHLPELQAGILPMPSDMDSTGKVHRFQ